MALGDLWAWMGSVSCVVFISSGGLPDDFAVLPPRVT